MKMILRWRKHPYITRVSILLIAAALIVGMVSCTGGATFTLTMAVAPPFSGTAKDVTGGSPYEAATPVQIQAAVNGSYQFCKWTSSAGGTFADSSNPTTTFTMPANDVIVTANFVGPLDHYKAYDVKDAPSLNKNVSLKDQFIELDAKVDNAAFFCNPTTKVPYMEEPTQRLNPDNHLTVYWITHTEYGRSWNVEVTNQFNDGEPQYLTVGGPVALAVPTQKLEPGNHTETLCLDHYLVYVVMNEVYLEEPPVQLEDEFGSDPEAYVGKAIYFANPVQKTVGTEVTNITTDEHLLFYEISNTEASCQQVVAVNQLSQDQQLLNLGDPAVLLGVPSVKVEWGAQYDHFTAYEVTEPPYVGKEVSLVDQLLGNPITTNVTSAGGFCNPAWKSLTETPGVIAYPDYHLTLYNIDWPEYQWRYWTVAVENQFGQQYLEVEGPVGLAVPTQKLVPGDHEFPEGVDHFLLYEVTYYLYSPDQDVALHDQFVPPGVGDWVTVYEPVLFAVPAEKKVGDNTTEITNPLTHVLFYYMEGADYGWPQVTVRDQFHEQAQLLPLGDYPPDLLGVPTMKLAAVEE